MQFLKIRHFPNLFPTQLLNIRLIFFFLADFFFAIGTFPIQLFIILHHVGQLPPFSKNFDSVLYCDLFATLILLIIDDFQEVELDYMPGDWLGCKFIGLLLMVLRDLLFILEEFCVGFQILEHLVVCLSFFQKLLSFQLFYLLCFFEVLLISLSIELGWDRVGFKFLCQLLF